MSQRDRARDVPLPIYICCWLNILSKMLDTQDAFIHLLSTFVFSRYLGASSTSSSTFPTPTPFEHSSIERDHFSEFVLCRKACTLAIYFGNPVLHMSPPVTYNSPLRYQYHPGKPINQRRLSRPRHTHLPPSRNLRRAHRQSRPRSNNPSDPKTAAGLHNGVSRL